MPKVYALTCPHCRAPLPAVPPGAPMVTCEYCGKSSNVSHTMHLPTPPRPGPGPGPGPGPTMQSGPVPQRPRSASGARVAIGISMGVAVLAAVTVPTLRQAMRAQSAGRGPGGGGTTPPGEHLQWAGDAPVVVDLDGDGQEDIVGLYRLLPDHGGGDAQTYLGAFTSRGWKRVWHTVALGPSDNNITLGAAGTAVLLVDAHGGLKIYERGTGAVRAQAVLSDAAERICAVDAEHAWIQVADETSVMVTLATGETKAAPRPAACPVPHGFAECSGWELARGDATPNATCVPGVEDGDWPAPPGTSVYYGVQAGGAGVMAGVKSKGTTLAMLAGFDATRPHTPARWVRRVNPDPEAIQPNTGVGTLDIANGVLYLAYQTSAERMLMQASDAATGTVKWESELPRARTGGEPRALTITATRLYVPHWTWLDIYDAQTGTHLETIGIW